jgi:hypothetical protein
MSKEIKKIEISIIEKVYNNITTKISYDDFLKLLITETNSVKELKKKKEEEERSKIYIDNVYPEIDEDISIDDYLEGIVEEYEWWDVFYDSDGMPDEGLDDDFYVMVGDKVYKIEVHCEANWVGDWSVRKNLPGDVTINDFNEVNFELLEKHDGGAKIKLL